MISVSSEPSESEASKGPQEDHNLPGFVVQELNNRMTTAAMSQKMHIDRNFGPGRTPGRPRKPSTKQMEAMVPTPFADMTKGHIQNEALAISIMRGDFGFQPDMTDDVKGIERSTSAAALQSIMMSPIKTKADTGAGLKMRRADTASPTHRYDRINGRYQPKLRYEESTFLGVASRSAAIPTEAPRDQLNANIEKRKNDQGRSKLYTFAGRQVESVPAGHDPFPRIRPSTVAMEKQKNDSFVSIRKAAKMYRDSDRQRNIAQARLARHVAMDTKTHRNDESSTRTEIRKKFSEFRDKLRKRLEDQKHPQITYVMRCIDDSMIYHFVEKYKGNNVTVDAIINFLVTSVGAGATETPISGEEIEPRHRHRAGWVPVTGPYSPERLVQTLVRSTPGFMPEVGMSLGARLNLNPDPVATLALDDEDIQLLQQAGLSKYGEWGLRKGTANDRPLSRSRGWSREACALRGPADARPPFGGSGKPDGYTIGAGFRGPVTPQRAPPAFVLDAEYMDEDARDPMRPTESFHSVMEAGTKGNPLSVPPAAYLQEMHATWANAEKDPFRTGGRLSPTGAPIAEGPPDASEAMVQVEAQMRMEGNLPSQQPIRALSDRQIEMIGKHEKTFDAVAESMDLAKKFGLTSAEDMDSGDNGTVTNKSPLTSAKEHDASQPNSSRRATHHFGSPDNSVSTPFSFSNEEGAGGDESGTPNSRQALRRSSELAQARRMSDVGQLKPVPSMSPAATAVQKSHHRQAGTRMEALRGSQAPIGLPTRDTTLQAGPRMPYALGDELGKIMCSGIASGAGMSSPVPKSNIRPPSKMTVGHRKGVLRTPTGRRR